MPDALTARRSPEVARPEDVGSVTWRIHREMVLLLGWGRAILLQLASPLVARGVAEHTAFQSERWGRLRRLHGTLRAMLTMTFGTAEEAAAVARHINTIHDRVHGRLDQAAGALEAGAVYSAHDPALLRWVHATLVDSFLLAYELYVGPLTAEEKDRYCEETARLEPLLGIPAGTLPRCAADLRRYMDGLLGSGEIAVTDTARTLARDVIAPPVILIARPLLRLTQLPTLGLLPPGIRAAYGFPWDARRERAFSRSVRAIRALLPWLPRVLRHWPIARRAARRAGAIG